MSQPTFQFLGGKGGVGKTTCAAAWAVRRAERDESVLLVSTDPAHSLGDALRRDLDRRARHVRTRRGRLYAAELDADRALERWLRDRRPVLHEIAERGTYLDDEDIERLFDLSFPGVDELMGLLELVRLSRGRRYDRVVVDMAPTGHALRMLAMPDTLERVAAVLDGMEAKHRYMLQALGGRPRADATETLVAELERDAGELRELLRDPERSTFTWVVLPEPMTLAEAEDGARELEHQGIGLERIVLNRWTADTADEPCAGCRARVEAEHRAASEARRMFPDVALRLVPALDREPRGLEALRRMAVHLDREPHSDLSLQAPASGASLEREAPGGVEAGPRAPLRAAELLAPPGTRLVVFAGKGGVGKTTCAAATALAVASRDSGSRALLLSADPAHSLGDVLGAEVGDAEVELPGTPAGLRVRELDAPATLERARESYRDEVDALFDRLLRGSRFDASFDRRVMRDLVDMTPPGLDELFAVLAVVDALGGPESEQPAYDLVVLDAAPTGHALRLLRMPELALSWIHAILRILLKYREALGLGEVAADLLARAREMRALIELLHDPERCGVVAVTRAAALPRLETERLLTSLAELEIPVGGVVINAVTEGTCGRCTRAGERERKAVRTLRRGLREGPGGTKWITTPAVHPPPAGPSQLLEWASRWEELPA